MTKYPGFHLTPASQWVALLPDKRDMLRGLGGFAVNDSFIPIWERAPTKELELILFMGGYGSSKTTDRIQELILCAITDKYFRCYYGRDKFETAKKELQSNIITVIKDMGLEDLFTFSEKPNGSKEISCKANGNRFRPFGCNDPGSLKGIDNPTHIFVDEINYISFESFGTLLTRLRSKKGSKCFVGCFNTCDVLEDHWIRTVLLDRQNPIYDIEGNEIDFNIVEHFSTYKDNHFIDRKEYMQQMSVKAGGDPERMDAYINGTWGAKLSNMPFYKKFHKDIVYNPAVHIGHRCEYKPNLPLWVSWDENKNPYLPVSLFQDENNVVYLIDEIAAKNPYNSLEDVCREIRQRYAGHQSGMVICGDASSRKGSATIEADANFFTLALEYLEIFRPKLMVDGLNPNVNMRGDFVNAIFSRNIFGIKVLMNPKCIYMIRDMKYTEEDPGKKGKNKTRKEVNGVRGVQEYGHFSDTLDYYICSRFKKEYFRFQTGSKTRMPISGAYATKNMY